MTFWAMLWLAVAALGAALRGGRPLARALVVLAALALAIGALDPMRARAVERPPQVVALCTAAGELADRTEGILLGAHGLEQQPRAELLRMQGDPATELARAALLAGPRASERLLVWTGPVEVPLRAVAGTAWTAAPPLRFAAGDLQLRLSSPPVRDRPCALMCRGEAPVPLQCEVRIGPADKPWFVQQVELPVGASLQFDLQPPVAGVQPVTVQMRDGDDTLELRGAVEVAPAAPVLVVESGAIAGPALRAQGIEVVAANELPDDLAGFRAVALLAPLEPRAQERLAAAVRDGLGLFVAGAALPRTEQPLSALLPFVVLPQEASGNAGRRIDEPSTVPNEAPAPPPQHAPEQPPVKQEPPKGEIDKPGPVRNQPVEVERRSLAMVLVVDRSGSMGAMVRNGMTKMSYAKTSAWRTAQMLEAGDLVGVVTFGDRDRGRVVLPLTDATDRPTVRAGIDKLAHASEMTYLLSGLEAAGRLLVDCKVAVKHIVVISDGGVVTTEELALVSAARQLREKGVTVSMIQVADSETNPRQRELAERMTRSGGGQYLPEADPGRVPVLVAAEVAQALGSVGRKPGNAPPEPLADNTPPPPPPPVRQEEPKPDPKPDPKPEPPPPDPAVAEVELQTVVESPLLQPVPPHWPRLGGHIACLGRDDSQHLLVVRGSGQTVLSVANRGLGRVAAFAADLDQPAAKGFRDDPAFPGRLAQWVLALQRPLPAAPTALPLQASADVSRPDRAAIEALAQWSGRPVAALTEYRVPPPSLDVQAQSLAGDWAMAAFVALLVLAFGEWWLVRRAP